MVIAGELTLSDQKWPVANDRIADA